MFDLSVYLAINGKQFINKIKKCFKVKSIGLCKLYNPKIGCVTFLN